MTIPRSWLRSLLSLTVLVGMATAAGGQPPAYQPQPGVQLAPQGAFYPPAAAAPGYPVMGQMPMGQMPMGQMPMGQMPMGQMPMPGYPQMASHVGPGGAPAPLQPIPEGGDYYSGAQPAEYYAGEYGGAADDFDLRFWRRVLPFSEGGCCAQRWYDVRFAYINWTREDVARTTNFMSAGVNPGANPAGMVLTSDSLAFDNGHGFRAGAALQLGPGNALEVDYIGMANWAATASVTDPTNNLFSAFSRFGTFPIVGVGFQETDRASFADIEYSSTFDSIELNYRQRWTGPNCRIQGSTMIGVRHFKMDEEFQHRTIVTLAPGGDMTYQIATANNMTGMQLGGDLWACVFPGLRIGADLKAGIYGNRAEQVTNIQATTLVVPVNEVLAQESAALVAEAGFNLLWRINQRWTLQAGYQFLYVDGVALAIENFNSGPPFVAGQRTPFINDNGNVFYHGLTAGLEWMW